VVSESLRLKWNSGPMGISGCMTGSVGRVKRDPILGKFTA